MAIAFVGETDGYGQPSAGSIAATAYAHATGNLLVVFVCAYQTDTTISVADTAGNTYTSVVHSWDTDVGLFECFYAKNITGHATNVVTATFGANKTTREISVLEYSGCDTVSPLDTHNVSAADAVGTAQVTAVATTNVADEVIVAGYDNASKGTVTAGANFTARYDGTYLGTEDRIVSSTGSYGSAMTYGVSSHYLGIHATFKIASATYSKKVIIF